MNGRLYDAKLHRFLQPDNYVQDPGNTQNYNRYGYVLNNPLKYIDPSGEQTSPNCDTCGGFNLDNTQYGNGIIKSILGDPNVQEWLDRNLSARNFGDAADFVWGNVKSFGRDIGHVADQAWGGIKSFGRAIGRLFGGGKKSGPPPNMGTNVNMSSYTSGTGGNSLGQSGRNDNWAKATLAFISADAAILEPTDAYWPKWVVEGAAGLSAAAYLYSGDYMAKMQREIARISQRAAGPQGFVYELVATRNGSCPNLNTGGTMDLKIGDVWKYGQTTKGFGRYSQSDLRNKGLKMIPLPPGGNQVEVLIQEKYYIYSYFFANGHRPPGNPIFR